MILIMKKGKLKNNDNFSKMRVKFRLKLKLVLRHECGMIYLKLNQHIY